MIFKCLKIHSQTPQIFVFHQVVERMLYCPVKTQLLFHFEKDLKYLKIF